MRLKSIKTIAILGSGLNDDVIYPRSNQFLAEQILESGGALISELAPHTLAAQHTFPKRNRIAAGMSNASLIIEAAEKSGTLITARLAMDYNRDVLTVPGSIYSVNSEGPHYLIKNGATPITCSEDILRSLDITVSSTQELDLSSLNSKEKLVFELILAPIDRQELANKCILEVNELNVTLSALELKGIIRERLGKIERT